MSIVMAKLLWPSTSWITFIFTLFSHNLVANVCLRLWQLKGGKRVSSSDKVSQLIFTEKMFYVLGEQSPPICYGQSVLTKESPTIVIYIYYTERKECRLMTSTKERSSVSTDKVIIPHKIRFVSAFFWKIKIFIGIIPKSYCFYCKYCKNML